MKHLKLLFVSFALATLLGCGSGVVFEATSSTPASNTGSTITVDQTDSDGTVTGFGGGTHTGTAYSGSVLTLADAGGCDATATNCAELDESWTPQWSNLVSYWKFDESSWTEDAANTVIDSKGTNHGTPKDDANTTASAKIGAYAGTFDGTTDYVDTSFLTPAGDKTMLYWVNFDTVTSGSLQLTGVQEGNANFYLGIDNSSQLYAFHGNTGGAYSTTVPAGLWMQLGLVMDAGTARIYLNGNEVHTMAYAISDLSTVSFRIGTVGAGSGPVFGDLDDLAVWSEALTADEVALIYSRQSAKYSGEFKSRVMDSQDTSASWTNLDWISTLPFYKELPDGGGTANSESSSSYPSLANSSLMDGIVGLWHMNGTEGTIADNAVISDSSGSGYNGAAKDLDGTNTIGYVQGRLAQGIEFDGSNDYIEVPYSATLAPTAGLTASVWFKTSDKTVTQSILSNTDTGGYNIYIFGGTGEYNCSANTLCSEIYVDGNYIGFSGYSTNNINNNQWYHAAVTYDGTTAKLFVDGINVGATAPTTNKPIQYSANTNPLCFGAEASVADCTSDGGNYLDGSLDEVAVWSRALSDDEVLQLYRRGANRIKHQIRSCTSEDCSDQESISPGNGWKGPGGNYLTYFSELHNNSSVSATCTTTIQCFMRELSLDGDVLNGLPSLFFSNFTTDGIGNSSAHPSGKRYFQYRTILESDDENTACSGSTATCMPELKSVTIGPEHTYTAP